MLPLRYRAYMGRSAVAILDVDGTLHPRSIGLALIERMERRGLGGPDALPHIAALWSTIMQFRRGEIEFVAMVRATTAFYGAALRGLHTDDLAALARETWSEMREDLFPFVRPLIERLAAAGVHPYIVSSSPHEIVGLLAAELGVDDYQGAHFVALGGHYTGTCAVMPGAPGGKLGLLRGLATSRGANLENCLALGNGEGDLEVLGAVGHPLVFEAASPLLDLAGRRGWPRVDRHDVLDQLARALSP